MEPTTATRSELNFTENYDQFKLIGANRDVDVAHVNRIKKSIEQDGNFTVSQPIIVNENFEVIDGQHRLTALSELGQPVYYVVREGLTMADARRMNLLHRNWRTADYLKTYVAEGRPSYIKLKQLLEEFPLQSMTTLITVATQAQNNGEDGYRNLTSQLKNFRNGDTPDFDLAKAQKLLTRLEEYAFIAPQFRERNLSRAVIRAMFTAGYSHAQMKEKLTNYAHQVRPYTGLDDNMRMLEDIYNQRVQEHNKLRFF